MAVHNHGTEDGPGLSCHELRMPDGSLKGACLREKHTKGESNMPTPDGRCDYNLDHQCTFGEDDVEDIAMAIFSSDGRHPWSAVSEITKNGYRENARAVIEMLNNRKEK